MKRRGEKSFSYISIDIIAIDDLLKVDMLYMAW